MSSSGSSKNLQATDGKSPNIQRAKSNAKDGGSRASGNTSASDNESGKAGKERQKKLSNGTSSKDSSQGSAKLAGGKDGKSNRRAVSQTHLREKLESSQHGDSDSGTSSQSTGDLRAKSKANKTSKNKDGSSSDSGVVKDKSPTPDKGDQSSKTNGEDPTVSVDDTERTAKTPRTARSIDPNSPVRLLILSSKIKNSTIMQHALVGNVLVAHYKYESSTLESLLGECGTIF